MPAIADQLPVAAATSGDAAEERSGRRILILGDSLPCPMPHRGQPLEVTWPALLRQRLPGLDVWHRARPRWCSFDVLAEFGLFTDSLVSFDAVIVQIGIVDCGPRPYPRWLFRLLELFTTYGQMRRLDGIAHRRFLWVYGRPWVTRGQFKANLESLVATAAARNPRLRVAFVPILPPTRRLVRLLPGIAASAARYNEVLRELAREHPANAHAVEPYAAHDPHALTLEDGQHLTRLGHELIAAHLAAVLFAPFPSCRNR